MQYSDIFLQSGYCQQQTEHLRPDGDGPIWQCALLTLSLRENISQKMADNYLERKMEEYRSRQAAGRPAATLNTLLLRNRSYRGYDPRFVVRADQLRRIIDVNTRIPSARNQQVLRFRPVLRDEAGKVLPHIRLGGALPDLKLPLPGTEPNAFIIVCSTVEEDRYVDIDLGIAVRVCCCRPWRSG